MYIHEHSRKNFSLSPWHGPDVHLVILGHPMVLGECMVPASVKADLDSVLDYGL
jgi:hypothetical protein